MSDGPLEPCCRGRGRNRRIRAKRGSWRALPLAALAALIPKCPACLLFWIGAVGFGGGLAEALTAHVDHRMLVGARLAAAMLAAFFVVQAWLPRLAPSRRRGSWGRESS
jgi:hypothetical protein